MNPRIARLKRLGPVGAVIERAASAALTRRVFGKPARRLAKAWRRNGGRSATYRVDWSPRARRWEPATASNCHCCSTRPRGPMRRCSVAAPVDDHLADTMRRNWAGFAHNGIAGLDSPSLHFG